MDAKTKWNERYKEQLKESQDKQPNERLISCSPYFKGKRVLDLAAGLGKNSIYLAKQGFHVTAIDISDVAIQFLQKAAQLENLPIDAKVIDLTNYAEIKQLGKFDVIVCTFYLDRHLFETIHKLLKKNGLFFMETFFHSPNVKRDIPKKYALHSQELLRTFPNYKVLFFEEDEKEGRQTILCEKIND